MDVKKFIVSFLLVFVLILGGCSAPANDNVIILPEQSVPETETAPQIPITPSLPEIEVLPDIENGNSGGDEDNKDEVIEETEEEKKKKAYAVSKVDSLRLRSLANSTSTVVGYLDKGDAVLITEETSLYYKTLYKEKTAYVYKSYCTFLEVDVAGEAVERAIDLGSTLLGYPYVWGSQRYHWGNGVLNKNFKNGEFDCSALVQYVYYISNGVILDVNTRTQVYNGKEVKREQLSRGDLMFFTNASRKNKTGVERIGHVGIYFGNNYILHTASDHAVIEPISALRWSYYETARRVM